MAWLMLPVASSSALKSSGAMGKAGGVGAGALFSAAGRRIDAAEIPDRKESCVEGAMGVSCLPGLVKFAVSAIHHDQVTVLFIDPALVPGLTLYASTGGKGNRRHDIGIPEVEAAALMSRN